MISAEGLTKCYGEVRAVDGLTFQVAPSQVTGFLGPNGAGKSTTMRLILGLERPSAGTVTVNGRPFASIRRPLREVGALLDAKAFHPDRSAYQHLRCLALSNGLPVSRARAVLEQVGLSAVANSRVRTFSLGMTQRLGVAGALLGDPAVLLFDEPVNGLDPEGIRWMRLLLRELAADGRTVLVSSHLMSEMALTADHLLVIGRGRLIADTDVATFIATHSLGRLVVRSPQLARLQELIGRAGGASQREDGRDQAVVSGLTVEQVGHLAADHAVPLYGLDVQEASLEEAFMALTRDSVDYRSSTAAGPDD
ncbi:MAG: ABC transporter ATP-binding protein [Mycobacteriales bacterium]